MAKKDVFLILANEDVNDYGFRMLMSGGDLSRLQKNPVLLYNHQRSVEYPYKENALPIGKMNNIEFQGDKLVFKPEFDDDDDFAKKVEKKFDKGYLNTASIRIKIVDRSEDPAFMLPGQTRATVTKWIALEGSITDIPGNAGCHRLSYEGRDVMLGDDTDEKVLDEVLPLINNHSPNNLQMSTKTDNILALTLGFKSGEEVSDVQLLAKITEIKNENARLTAEHKTLSDDNIKLKKQLFEDKVKLMLDTAEEQGKIVGGQRGTWEKLASTDYDGTKAALDGMKAYKAPVDKIREDADDTDASLTDAQRYKQLDKENKLSSLPKEEQERLRAAFVKHMKQSGKTKD